MSSCCFTGPITVAMQVLLLCRHCCYAPDTVAMQALFAMQVAEMLSGSLELGCFLAGVIISSRGSSETEQVLPFLTLRVKCKINVTGTWPGLVDYPKSFCCRVLSPHSA